MSATTSFRVYGLEFCQVLHAVGMFQGSPRVFEGYAAVRCIYRHDGLTMVALNGLSSAAGHIDTIESTGATIFSIPHTQVKALLAIFQRPLPKHTHGDEYVLEVTVADRWVKVHDVSTLFEGDEYVMALPDPAALEAHEESDATLIMRTATSVLGAVEVDAPLDLTSGVHFSATEVARIARAAKALGADLYLRAEGRMLIAPISRSFVATTLVEHHDPEETRRDRFPDGRALAEFRDRLVDIVEQGAL